MKKISTKTNITPPPRNAVIAWVLALLSIILITGSVLAAGRCVPCKLNHYCIDGLRYQCPANTPVTQGTGAGALSECLTCVQRNGNEGNPIYDDLVGDCVSCYEYDSSTPIWNGTACVACESGTAFNGETGLCEKTSTCGADYIAINSASDLAKIGNDANYPLNGNYCLQNNISLANYGSSYNNGKGWTPIGNSTTPFTGIFDGNNYAISDLYIASDYYLGLFGYTQNAQIRNLNLTEINISGTNTIGGLVGYSKSTNVYNCSTNGLVEGATHTGGLVGYNDNGEISNSYSLATMETFAITYTTVGEKANTNPSGSSIPSPEPEDYSLFTIAGGLVGTNTGTIEQCYVNSPEHNNSGNIPLGGLLSVGGLVGKNSGDIENSYALTKIYHAESYGFNLSFTTIASTNDGTINNCYGVVPAILSDNDIYYGFLWSNSGTVNNSYFYVPSDADRTFICGGCNDTTSIEATGKTIAELQTPTTFSGWDTSIWELVQGQYPKLKGVGGQD